MHDTPGVGVNGIILRPLAVGGACLIEIEPSDNSRGIYAQSLSGEFRAHRLTASFVEGGISRDRGFTAFQD